MTEVCAPRPYQEKLSEHYQHSPFSLCVAESCTGGLISHLITNVPGSSRYFVQSVVSYSNQAKEDLLNVNHSTLIEHGAVSKETALEMAEGIRKSSACDISISVTGIAGPGGGTKEKPVGLVFISLATKDITEVWEHRFPGERREIKSASANAALSHLDDWFSSR